MKHNIALEMAKKILQTTLAQLDEIQTVGDNHGYMIKWITRIENNSEGHYQFLVQTDDEMSTDPDEKPITMGAFELTQLISNVLSTNLFNWEEYSEYIKQIPIVNESPSKLQFDYLQHKIRHLSPELQKQFTEEWLERNQIS